MELPEQIKKLADDVQAGLKALQAAQEKAQKDTDSLIKGEIDRITDETSKKMEELQEKQAKLQAVLERASFGKDKDGETEEQKAEKASFNSFLRKGDSRKLTELEVKSLSTDVLDSGGYMVPTQMLGMINGCIFETSPLRRIASVITTSAKSVEVVLDDDEAGASWAGEGATVSESNTPTIGKLEIVTKKAQAYPKVTTEIVADAAFDVEAWLSGKISDRISRLENTAFVAGNGVNSPRGFLTFTAGTSTYARNTIEQVVNGSTDAPTEVGMLNLQGAPKEGYQPRAVWAMKRATFIKVMQLTGTNVFRFLNLQPQTGPSGQALPSALTLLEKPVVLMDDMPVIAANALSIAYGDFSVGYTIIDRIGLSVMADPYTAPGFIKYYATKRTGGNVSNYEAIKLLKFAAN